MALKQTIRKIWEFKNLKFVKPRLDYNCLLKQNKRTGKKVRTKREFEKSGVQKIGVQLQKPWMLLTNFVDFKENEK